MTLFVSVKVKDTNKMMLFISINVEDPRKWRFFKRQRWTPYNDTYYECQCCSYLYNDTYYECQYCFYLYNDTYYECQYCFYLYNDTLSSVNIDMNEIINIWWHLKSAKV